MASLTGVNGLPLGAMPINTGGITTPATGLPIGATPVNSTQLGDPTATGDPAGLGSNLVPSKVGPQEKQLDTIFSQSSQGLGGILKSLASGQLPQAMRDWITASTNEQFGNMGARFGTDLGTAISRGLGLAGAQQQQWSIGDILNLGGTTAGFEFQRSQDALNRALQEWITSQQTDPTQQILQSLLGG